jgi:hypothetical protein
MCYTEIRTCSELLAPMDAEIVGLNAQHVQLARTIKDKKDANEVATRKKDLKKVDGDEKRLKVIERRIDEAIQRRQQVIDFDISQPVLKHYTITKVYIDLFGRVWTERAKELNALQRISGEGWGEKGYRHMEGLSLVIAATGSTMDFPEKFQEGKSIERHAEEATCDLQSIRLGADALERTTLMVHRATKGLDPEKDLTPALWSKIYRGELGQETMSLLPTVPREQLQAAIKPSAMMSKYTGGVVCFTSYGYFVIPACDFDIAFKCKGISQGGPCYNLEIEEYLAVKIRGVLHAQQQADVAA